MKAADLLDFWFNGDPAVHRRDRWFKVDAAFDDRLRERFGLLAAAALDGALDSWQETPEGALALVIALDQIPRNIHRDSYQAFQGDAHARRVARLAVERGDDKALTPVQRMFLYMPFLHSEDLADQDTSLALFGTLSEVPEVGESAAYAAERRDVIRRFGRYPQRNAALGRDNTPEEAAYLAAERAEEISG
ncbi:MAG: DUF924 domain-containing protein [Acetobacteraceae bacterium]|nr:DUF924 domain-containing protein [Acetobacteraceae bacterium]